jgi:Ca2+-binding EF-hand superfamily protein
MSHKEKVLTEDEISKIKDTFDLLDTQGTEHFYPKDFVSLMESNGIHEKEPFIYSIIKELDTEEAEKNGISFDTLINVINDKLGHKKDKEGIKKIFDLFKDEKSDTINLLALKKAGNKYGQKMTNEQYKLLIEKASKNGNEITFDDFYKIMID